MFLHALIITREYGTLALVGTWVATISVKEGDVIRVGGTEGFAEIISTF